MSKRLNITIPHSLPQGDTCQIFEIEYIQKRVEFAGWLCLVISGGCPSRKKRKGKEREKHTVMPRGLGCRIPLNVGTNGGANGGPGVILET